MPDAEARDRPSPPLVNVEGLAGVTRALGWLLAVGGAGLVATGLPLIWLYQPDPAGDPRGDFWWLRGGHNVMSMLFLGAAVGLVAVLAVAAARRLRTRIPPGWFAALAALLIALLGLMSGQLIAWDALALRAVTVGRAHRGVVDALGGDVRFIIVGDTGVARGTYAAWAGVHVLGVPLVAAGLAWLLRRRPPG